MFYLGWIHQKLDQLYLDLFTDSSIGFLLVDVLMLGYMGAMPAEGIYLVLARVGTIYYFLHFIVVLPVVGY